MTRHAKKRRPAPPSMCRGTGSAHDEMSIARPVNVCLQRVAPPAFARSGRRGGAFQRRMQACRIAARRRLGEVVRPVPGVVTDCECRQPIPSLCLVQRIVEARLILHSGCEVVGPERDPCLTACPFDRGIVRSVTTSLTRKNDLSRSRATHALKPGRFMMKEDTAGA